MRTCFYIAPNEKLTLKLIDIFCSDGLGDEKTEFYFENALQSNIWLFNQLYI